MTPEFGLGLTSPTASWAKQFEMLSRLENPRQKTGERRRIFKVEVPDHRLELLLATTRRLRWIAETSDGRFTGRRMAWNGSGRRPRAWSSRVRSWTDGNALARARSQGLVHCQSPVIAERAGVRPKCVQRRKVSHGRKGFGKSIVATDRAKKGLGERQTCLLNLRLKLVVRAF